VEPFEVVTRERRQVIIVLKIDTNVFPSIEVSDYKKWTVSSSRYLIFFLIFPEVYTRQIIESKAKLVLVDADTAPVIKTAIGSVDWEMHLLSVGINKVEDAISYEDLCLEEDSSGF
jgi:hypothetical protein